MKEARERAAKKKRKQQKMTTTPGAYLGKLIQAASADKYGKLLAVYKKLGRAQEGRKFIEKLEGKSWNDIPPIMRKKLGEISKEYPL